ncbi:MAG: IS630 family transposase [Candidatus Woesearchaeota archaeon]
MDCSIVNFDEATFRLVPVKQKIWAKKGSKPQLPFWFSSTKANIIGALVDGKKMFYDWYDRLNAHCFVEFLKKFILTLNKDKKYVFILDNAPAHRAKMTKNFIESISQNIFIEFLPPYSPQLNCIETCWKIVRHDVTSSNFFKSIETLKYGIEMFLDNTFFMFNPSNYLSR